MMRGMILRNGRFIHSINNRVRFVASIIRDLLLFCFLQIVKHKMMLPRSQKMMDTELKISGMFYILINE